MKTSTFTKALACLARPATLLAVVVLFVNDHVLRVYWPSWITGKLGDVAWLYFMPFVVAAGVAWLVPQRVRRHAQTVGLLSVGSVALVFVLGNTWPAPHRWVVAAASWLFGLPVRLTRDPTDLFALVACALAWRVWQRTPAPRWERVKARAWLLLPAAALLTVANAAAPDYGISCLRVEEGRVLAFAEYQAFASPDGGLTWAPYTGPLRYPCDTRPWGLKDRVRSIADPDDPEVLYRLGPDKVWAYSRDGGEIWYEIPQLEFSSQAELAFYMSESGTAQYASGPFDVVRDPESGNLVLAMGLEGVVVQTAGGAWRRVAVGEYGLSGLTTPNVVVLLFGELLLAGELALVIFSTLALVSQRRWWALGGVLIVVGGLWGVIAVGLQPALNRGYAVMLQTLLLIVVALLGLGSVVLSGLRLRGNLSFGKVLLMIGAAICGAFLFIVPYALWAVDLIHNYTTAAGAALTASVALMLVGGALSLSRRRGGG